MICARISAYLLLAMSLGTPAVAGDPPAPRTPIGPRVMEMLPPPSDSVPESPPPLSADTVRIKNVGDQKLFFSYWDGQSAWQTVSIESNRSTDILCAKCGGTIVDCPSQY